MIATTRNAHEEDLDQERAWGRATKGITQKRGKGEGGKGQGSTTKQIEKGIVVKERTIQGEDQLGRDNC